MTLSGLIKRLQKLEAMGHSRRKVAIDKPTFWDGNETFSICEVKSADRVYVRTVDGDGFGIINADGSERGSVHIVLSGSSKK